jgi:hypothetical protein
MGSQEQGSGWDPHRRLLSTRTAAHAEEKHHAAPR